MTTPKDPFPLKPWEQYLVDHVRARIGHRNFEDMPDDKISVTRLESVQIRHVSERLDKDPEELFDGRTPDPSVKLRLVLVRVGDSNVEFRTEEAWSTEWDAAKVFDETLDVIDEAWRAAVAEDAKIAWNILWVRPEPMPKCTRRK